MYDKVKAVASSPSRRNFHGSPPRSNASSEAIVLTQLDGNDIDRERKPSGLSPLSDHEHIVSKFLHLKKILIIILIRMSLRNPKLIEGKDSDI